MCFIPATESEQLHFPRQTPCTPKDKIPAPTKYKASINMQSPLKTQQAMKAKQGSLDNYSNPKVPQRTEPVVAEPQWEL